MKLIYDTLTGSYILMNFGPDPQPTPKQPQPTLEQCLALMKTAKWYVPGWHIAVFSEEDIRVYREVTFLKKFDNIAQLHAWLLERQPSKTVTVEILREDAATLHRNLSPGLNPFGSRICRELKKALEN